MAPWPKRITDEGFLEFRDNGSPEYERIKDKKIPADIVVFATGYKRVVKFLDAAYPQPGDVDVRGIYHHDDVTVAFIGFMRPSLGKIHNTWSFLISSSMRAAQSSSRYIMQHFYN